MNSFMITGQNDLFCVSPSKQEYLRGVGVQGVTFLNPHQANVTLIACTPNAITTLMTMANDVTLEIVNRDHGFREEHTCDDVIVRMSHCRFYERWFNNLVPIHAVDSEQVTLYAEMVCELEVLLDR